jgi:hypothetical protein
MKPPLFFVYGMYGVHDTVASYRLVIAVRPDLHEPLGNRGRTLVQAGQGIMSRVR